MVEVSTPFHLFIHRLFCFCLKVLARGPPTNQTWFLFRVIRYVHGLRVVCPPYSVQPGEFGCVLEVFDFNLHPKKLPEAENTTWDAQASGRRLSKDTEGGTNAAGSRSSTPGPSSPSHSSSSSHSTRPSTPISNSFVTHEVIYSIHTESSTISAPGVFVNNVTSKLPYSRTVRKDLTTMYSGFMIDDERIVGLKVGCNFHM